MLSKVLVSKRTIDLRETISHGGEIIIFPGKPGESEYYGLASVVVPQLNQVLTQKALEALSDGKPIANYVDLVFLTTVDAPHCIVLLIPVEAFHTTFGMDDSEISGFVECTAYPRDDGINLVPDDAGYTPNEFTRVFDGQIGDNLTRSFKF